MTQLLPSGWAEAQIGDLIGPDGIFSDGDWVESKDQDPDGTVRLIQLADVGDGGFRDRSSRFMNEAAAERLNCTYLAAGDVLIARMPDPLGRACQLPERITDTQPCVTAVDVCIVRPGESSVVPPWVVTAVNSPQFRVRVAALQTGTTRKRISRKNLGTIPLFVPPVPEQRRIVAKIGELFSELDAGTEALERAQTKLERYRASVLKAAVEGKLTEAWRRECPPEETGQELLERILVERRARWEEEQFAKYEAKVRKPPTGWQAKYKEPVGPDSDELQALPKGWCWASVDQVTTRSVGHAFKSSLFSEEGLPLLRGQNVEPGSLRWNDVRYWPTTLSAEFGHLLVRSGDIILAMDRPVISTGLKIAIALDRDVPCLLVQRVARIRPVDSFDAAFLYVLLRTQRFISYLRGEQTGTQLPHISEKQIAGFPIPIPPCREQIAMAESVDRLDLVTTQLQDATARGKRWCLALRESILKRGFEGHLVPQDPDDEPASVLLERIRAEREAAPPRKKRRTRKKTAQPALDL